MTECALRDALRAQADEDTRRAMNKSFQESNGTVLSTNWRAQRSGRPHCVHGCMCFVRRVMTRQDDEDAARCRGRREIGTKPTDFLPPDGMEARKFEF